MKFAYEKYKALRPDGRALWMQDREAFIEAVVEESRRCQTVSVKGSNFMKLAEVVKVLIEEAGKKIED